METPPQTDEQNLASKPRPFAEPLDAYGGRLALLSTRERAVLDLAAEGFTDEQIAQSLEISVSTVNSYWVRIRGKLGSLGRVELVTGLLRHLTRLAHANLRAENEQLMERLGKASERFHQLRTAYDALQGDPWPLLALAHAPDAVLVTAPPATVVYANEEAHRLYLAGTGELEGLAMRELTTAATPEALREPCREMFQADGPDRERIGLAEPYYGQRRDGSNFRAVLEARRFETVNGPLAIVTVREFLGEFDAIFDALRQPLAA